MAKYRNQSIERAFSILEHLANCQEEQASNDVATALQLPVSTAFRFLSILVSLGYIEKTSHDKYRLGYRLYKLGTQASELTHLKRAAHQVLAELARRTRLTVHMGTLEGSQVVYHAKYESTHSISIASAVGVRLDAHVSAIGKVLLSHLNNEDLEALYSKRPLMRHTEKSITSLRALRRELATIFDQKAAIDNEEIMPGLRCVAVPVYDHTGQLVTAISISGSTLHLTNKTIPKLRRSLDDAADAISRQLAGSHAA
ncbi:IclR family transcriptional regulator [Lentisalinibacter orientalis]|uniref:IclR family transcriptional regulator n=1 Tax=Lentisalinibacter orientalis TaxID=2992241 RepID=UPI00386D2B38